MVGAGLIPLVLKQPQNIGKGKYMFKYLSDVSVGHICFVRTGGMVKQRCVDTHYPDCNVTTVRDSLGNCYVYPSDERVIPFTQYTASLTLDELLELFDNEEININYPEGKKEEAVDSDTCTHEFIDMFNSRACRICGIDERDIKKQQKGDKNERNH